MIYSEQKQNNFIYINQGKFEVLQINKREKGLSIKISIKNTLLELFAVACFFIEGFEHEQFFKEMEKNLYFSPCEIAIQGAKFESKETGEIIHYNKATIIDFETYTFEIKGGIFYKKETYDI